MARNKVSLQQTQQTSACIKFVVYWLETFANVSTICKVAIYNYTKRPIGEENEFDKRKLNKGRVLKSLCMTKKNPKDCIESSKNSRLVYLKACAN